MVQHFLLSAAARTLSLKAIFSEGEEAAYQRFCRLRWPETEGAPICPACGCLDIYDLSTRRRFKCAACHHQFSVTSGTTFASRKLSFVDLLGAICLFVNASKGLSAVQLSRDLDVQYKTAFVLMHKLREVMAAKTQDVRLTGHVEVDGAAFGGHVRPANAREDRVDRRLLRNRSGRRRVVVTLRQRGGRILALLEEAVADHVPGALLLRVRKKPDRRVDVRKVVPGLRDLRFIGRDPTMDFRMFVFQRLDDKRFGHAPLNRHDPRSNSPNPGASAT